MQLIQLEAKRQSKDGFGGLILPASAKTTASSLYGVIASAAQDGAFWNTRESLSAICQWSRARLVSPWAVLGCTLARVVTATPPAIALPTGAGWHTSLNMFVSVVGGVGSGKTAAAVVAREALDVGPLPTTRFGSTAGIAHHFMRQSHGRVEMHTESLLLTAEIDDAFNGISRPEHRKLVSGLKSAWAGGELNLSQKLPVPEHRYRLCLIGQVRPDAIKTAFDSFSPDDLHRFLWMPTNDPWATVTKPTEPPVISWSAPRPEPNTGTGDLCVMDVCSEVVSTLEAARLACLLDQESPAQITSLIARLKTAASLGLLEGRLSVTAEDWELAGVVQALSTAVLNSVLAPPARITKHAS